MVVPLLPATAADAAPPPAGALEGLGCIARPAAAAALGCAPGDETLLGIHQVVLGPGDAQLYVVAENEEDIPATASLTTYARDPATGVLTRTGCLDRTMGAGCVADGRLKRPLSIALSPDGADLYVADGGLGLIQYRRGADGALTFKSCVQDNDGIDDSPGCPVADGLTSATAVAVSPDGDFVYAAAYGSNAVSIFDREPADGTLTFLDCWASGDANTDACPHTVTGGALTQATDVAITPDGTQLYTSARQGDSVVRFNRNSGTGLFSNPQAFRSTDALDGSQTLSVAPGGEAVYVGIFDGHGLTALGREQGTGNLSLLGCGTHFANPACTVSPGVSGVFGLAFSADGSVLYAAARDGGTLASFRRALDGGLSPIECAHGATVPDDGCARVVNGLDSVESVAATADGRFVYAGGREALVALTPEYAPDCSPVSKAVPNSRFVDLTLTCTDRNSQPLGYSIATKPSHGRVALLDPIAGRVRYLPKAGYGGPDSFSFTAIDGTNVSPPALATLNVARDTTKPRLRILTRRVRATRRRVMRLGLRCLPGEPTGCQGRVGARSLKRVALPAALRSERILRLGSRAFHLRGGTRATIRLRLSKRAFAILKERQRLRLRVSARAKDAAGNVGRASRRVTLLAPPN
jgi:6-phosphogluconolactonase (cycloisomerase 2 family)